MASIRPPRNPADIAVVGFDDVPQASYFVPALTTVHQPLYEIGKLSCERLIELAHNKIDRVQEVLPIQLVVRESLVGLVRCLLSALCCFDYRLRLVAFGSEARVFADDLCTFQLGPRIVSLLFQIGRAHV